MKHTSVRSDTASLLNWNWRTKEHENYMQRLKQRIIKEEIEIISVFSACPVRKNDCIGVPLWQGIFR